MQLIKEGKIKAINARDLLDELQCINKTSILEEYQMGYS